ncbi:MAG: glycosyltransferase family 4 protein, partial [Actinomycetota bacterium]
PSEFVKGSVVDAYGIADERVLVVPHGVEATIGRSATDAETLRRKYRLGSHPMVVFPAVTHPHKGHLFLLDVMTRVDDDLTLVLIGGAGSAEAEVLRRLEDERLRTRVVKLGRVPADDRDGLVAMARAVVFPSEYEGFGAPVIEAMALGTPVIASDRTCLPEVVGEAGLIVPLEVQAWVDALRTVEARQPDLVTLGRRRVEQFSADRSGAALATAYRQAFA